MYLPIGKLQPFGAQYFADLHMWIEKARKEVDERRVALKEAKCVICNWREMRAPYRHPSFNVLMKGSFSDA
jgi:hypothetical protein